MIKVSHFGKMGDLVYALPVMRALARKYGEKIHLTTSGLCFSLVPLLWEQPYFEEVVVETSKPYKMSDGVMSGWDYYDEGEGINLSPQPAFYRPEAPIPWTYCYGEAAGIKEFDLMDFCVFPTLVNHRRWHFGHEVKLDGKEVPRPKTVIIAPEVESLEPASPAIWREVAYTMHDLGYAPIVIGVKPGFGQWDYMVGKTTVPTMARMIAEADAFIGAHSFPWHIARHSEVPAVCLQKWREGLARTIPIDTPYKWVEPDDYEQAINFFEGAEACRSVQ